MELKIYYKFALRLTVNEIIYYEKCFNLLRCFYVKFNSTMAAVIEITDHIWKNCL